MEAVNLSSGRPTMCKLYVGAAMVTAFLLAFAVWGEASPEVWATGTVRLSSDPGFVGYWQYCYAIAWSGLPHSVSHVELILCRPDDCDCTCSPEHFAFADTIGVGSGMASEDPAIVHYYGHFELLGDRSTGLQVTLLKFEPFEGLSEPAAEGSADLCFYSLAPPVQGNFTNHISVKCADEVVLGDLDGPLPGCDTLFSPNSGSTWGYVKTLYR